MVFQELLAFPNLTVAANIFAGREITGARRRARRARRCAQRTRELLGAAAPVDSRRDAPMEHAVRRARAARAGRARARLRLPRPGARRADDVADDGGSRSPVSRPRRTCAARGVTILFVSHRLPGGLPALRSHHRPARRRVRRDVRSRGRQRRHDVVRAMVGRELPDARARSRRRRTAAVAAAWPSAVGAGRSSATSPCDVSRGEIVGVFGLVGSGRSELLETIFGLRRAASGEVLGRRPRRALRHRRARRRAPASRSCPRIASARGCSST